MNAPPPFQPNSYGKPSNRGLKIFLAIFFFVAVPCGALVFFGKMLLDQGLKLFNEKLMPTASCALSYQAIQSSFHRYADEHSGNLPPAANWEDDVRPYYRQALQAMMTEKPPQWIKLEPFGPDADWTCKADGANSRLSYNDEVAGKRLAAIQNPSTTVLLFETTQQGKNLHGPYKELDDKTSPKLMDKPRGWMVFFIKGMKKTRSDIDFNFGGGKSKGGEAKTSSGGDFE